MKQKILSLIGGFILSLLIILLAIYLYSRPAKNKIEEPPSADVTKLESVSDLTQGLSNNGNLPQQIQGSDVGRPNPFDDY